MELLLSTGSVSTLGPAEVFSVAREAGFDGLEYVVDNRHAGLHPTELRALAEAAGLPIRSVHAPYHRVQGWGDQVESLRRSVELARAFAAHAVTFHPPQRIMQDVDFARWIAEVNDFQGEVGGGDIVVAIENMPKVKVWRGHRVPFATTPYRYQRRKELRALLERHNLRLTLDTTHAAAAGERLDRYFARFEDRVAGIHLSNFAGDPRQEHLPPDQGDLDLAAFLQRVRASGFGGPITLEIQPRRLVGHEEGVAGALREAVNWVRRTLVGRETFRRTPAERQTPAPHPRR